MWWVVNFEFLEKCSYCPLNILCSLMEPKNKIVLKKETLNKTQSRSKGKSYKRGPLNLMVVVL